MTDHTSPLATRYLPQMVTATVAVAILPAVLVWWLHADGILGSAWLCLASGVALALAASAIGGAYWKRRPGSADLFFGELLVWSWVMRRRAERQVADAVGVLERAEQPLTAGASEASTAATGRMLSQLADSLDALDAYTAGHSRRVARQATLIAHRLGLSDEEVATIRAAAAVHDIGKLRVPREILGKPGKLTEEEFEITKRHSAEGAAIVAGLGDPALTAIVRHHHERIDGGGYPDALTADEIPLGARIVAVADTFDAITSTRSYRAAMTHQRAFELVREAAGTQLDPDVVDAFLSGYAGQRAVAAWAVLAVLPQRLLGRLGIGGATAPRPRPVQRSGAATAVTALALVAFLSPNGAVRAAPVRPIAAPVAVAAVSARAPDPRPRRATRPRARARIADASCQAYNPQLCATVVAAGRSPGAGGSGAAGGSPATVGTLPFTGLDTGWVALAGLGLLGLGTGLGRLGGTGLRRNGGAGLRRRSAISRFARSGAGHGVPAGGPAAARTPSTR